MPDSDDRSDTDQATEAAVMALAEEIGEDLASGRVQALLAGEANVMLAMDIEDVSTPEEAADVFISTLMRRGFDAFYVAVRDTTTDEVFYVHAGQIVHIDDSGKPSG